MFDILGPHHISASCILAYLVNSKSLAFCLSSVALYLVECFNFRQGASLMLILEIKRMNGLPKCCRLEE